jgi:hypothetical protein
MSFRERKTKRAVARGAALLDKHGPDGWRGLIDLGTLDIARSSRCVLGQVYGGYTTGMLYLHGANGHVFPCPERYGFICRDGASNEELTQAWREYLS